MTPRRTNGAPISLILFTLVAVLVFITAAGSMELWVAILAGISLAGTAIGAFADFHRRRG